MKTLDKYLLSVTPARNKPSVLYPSYLSSIANGSPQGPRCDLPSFSDSKQVFLHLIAIQDVTSLIVFPRSHLINLDSVYKFCPLRISLSHGQIIMFHLRLFHAGVKYSKTNLHLHYYEVDSLDCLANTTILPSIEQLNAPISFHSMSKFKSARLKLHK